MSRHPLIISSLNPVALAVISFVAIFTSLHVTIALVAVGILTDHLLRIVGVLLLKSMEILGKKYDRRRQHHNKQNSCPWTLADDTEKSLPDERAPFERVRTANSSVTAVSEEAPLDIKVCRNAAAKETHRFPGLFQSLALSLSV
jgi:hypothetical protein